MLRRYVSRSFWFLCKLSRYIPLSEEVQSSGSRPLGACSTFQTSHRLGHTRTCVMTFRITSAEMSDTTDRGKARSGRGTWRYTERLGEAERTLRERETQRERHQHQHHSIKAALTVSWVFPQQMSSSTERSSET